MGEHKNKGGLNVELQEVENPEKSMMGSAEIIFFENGVRKLGECAQHLVKGENMRCWV